jgi:hypothetical protein
LLGRAITALLSEIMGRLKIRAISEKTPEIAARIKIK